jgi:site-specific DNA recombinase
MKKIAEFTRVSSIGQVVNGSLDTQSINCHRKLEELGLLDKYEFVKFGGVIESAKTGGNKFQELEKALLSPKNDYEILIVNQMDRLSRNSEDGTLLIAKLRKEKVHIISADGKVNTIDNVDDYKEAIRLIESAEEDNLAKAYRTVSGNMHQLMKGNWIANAPFGYSRKSKYDFVPNDDAHYITTLFDMYLDGFSMKDIRIHFKEKGLVKSDSTLSDWIRNPFYCGRMVHKSYMEGKECIKGNHEPIVSPYIFERVQQSLVRYKKRDSIANEKTPLKKVLECSCCEGNMTSYKSKKIWYYKCNTDGCNNHFSAEMAHNALSNVIGSLTMDLNEDEIEEVIHELYEEYHSSDLQILKNRQAQLKAIKEQKETYINSCLEMGFGLISKEQMMARAESYDNQMKSVEESITKLNSIDFDEFKREQLSNISSLNEAIELGDIEQKQNTLSVLFEDKIIFNKKTESYENISLSPLFVMVA